MVPPTQLDGAKVLKWAWSGNMPFGYMPIQDTEEKISIYGLAVCTYENSGIFYLFSCDENWEVINDSFYDTIEQAIERLPNQYKKVVAVWKNAE